MGYGFPVAFYYLSMNSCNDNCAQWEGNHSTRAVCLADVEEMEDTGNSGKTEGHIVHTVEWYWPEWSRTATISPNGCPEQEPSAAAV